MHIFFTILIPDITHEERQLLDEAFIITYQKKGITHDNASLWDQIHLESIKEMPILGDLYQVLLEKEETRRMANILNRLVNGSSSNFNHQTNIDSDNNMILDISEMQKRLGTYTLQPWILYGQKQKEDRTKEKAILLMNAGHFYQRMN